MFSACLSRFSFLKHSYHPALTPVLATHDWHSKSVSHNFSPMSSALPLTPPSSPSHFQQTCYYTGFAHDHFQVYNAFSFSHDSKSCGQFYFSLPGPSWNHTYSRKPPRLANICLLPLSFHLHSLFRCEASLSIEVITEGSMVLSSLLFPISIWHKTRYLVGAHSMQMECHLTQCSWSEKTNKLQSSRALEL